MHGDATPAQLEIAPAVREEPKRHPYLPRHPREIVENWRHRRSGRGIGEGTVSEPRSTHPTTGRMPTEGESHDHADVADAARVYAKRVEIKMGEMLAQTDRAKGVAGLGRPKIGRADREQPKGAPTLSDLGLSKKVSRREGRGGSPEAPRGWNRRGWGPLARASPQNFQSEGRVSN